MGPALTRCARASSMRSGCAKGKGKGKEFFPSGGSFESKRTMVYNIMIKACANRGDEKSARGYFEKMKAEDVKINLRTYGKVSDHFQY